MFTVAIVGATGAVGIEIVKCLHKKQFPLKELVLFASERSAGKAITNAYGEYRSQKFSVQAARECDFVFLAVSGDFSLQYAAAISDNGGAFVIDNSSAFRYNAAIPLVVPEINSHILTTSTKLIANPNCTTAIAAVVLWPIHQKYKIKKLIVSTYQAASGAGAEGMEELVNGTASKLAGDTPINTVFVHPLPFNLIPHIDKFQENGFTKEEMKVVWETLKIFESSEEELKISCTAVRIPTLRAHSEAITLETELSIKPADVRESLRAAPGVRVVDDVSQNQYPMPLTAAESFDVEVGRIRQSLIFGDKGIDLFICGDQLLRGAALNAVLIAETILSKGLMQ